MESLGVLLEAAVPQIRVNQDAEEQHKILHGYFDAGMNYTTILNLSLSTCFPYTPG